MQAADLSSMRFVWRSAAGVYALPMRARADELHCVSRGKLVPKPYVYGQKKKLPCRLYRAAIKNAEVTTCPLLDQHFPLAPSGVTRSTRIERLSGSRAAPKTVRAVPFLFRTLLQFPILQRCGFSRFARFVRSGLCVAVKHSA